MLESMVIGFTYLLVLFLICFFCVTGVKYFLITFIKLPKKSDAKKTTTKKRSKKPSSPIRSIEINPSEIDRIYFGKR